MSGAFVHIRRRLVPAAALILVTALAASLGACEDLAPQFQVEGTGTVEGFLFLDADSDGLFDPSDGDAPVGGVGVAAVVRGTEDVITGTTTGPAGRFLLSDLPAGTLELLFDEGSVPEGVNVCQNPVRSNVFIGETTFTQVAARSACLISIAEAFEAPNGDFVIIRGIVTAFPGMFDEGDGAIQDDTHGMWLFDGSIEGLGIEVGDRIEVGGTVDAASIQAIQLTNVSVREIVPDVGAPAPIEVTTADIAAATGARDPLLNLLVTVRGAELLTGFTAGGSRNADIDDGSGVTIVRVESQVSPGSGDAILATTGMEVGKCYDITGIVGGFFGDGEIFPRQVSDVVEVPCD